ncbi:MAG: hypothetical protein H7293_04275 [Candidatus Saccharibacteria bacterium]|nr:hypothetical protein [Rhodoferax sp.]
MTTHHHLKSPSHLRLSVLWNIELDEASREAHWDALTIWCAQRGAYLGGTPPCACIVLIPARPRFTKQLERWLAAQRGISEFRVCSSSSEMATPLASMDGPNGCASVQTPQELSALLEALGNYQQHLVESLQHSIDILPQLSRALRGWRSGS